MKETRVECPLCGQKAWQRGGQEIFHAGCTKRGAGSAKKPAPKYVPVAK